MWLGERITDKGIGNGISIIIMIGIILFTTRSNEYEYEENKIGFNSFHIIDSLMAIHKASREMS